MSSPREQQVPALRYPVAVLACAVVIAVWIPILVGVCWLIFDYLDDWIGRQNGIIRIALQCIAGITILATFSAGVGALKHVWKSITLSYDARTDSQTHGRHAKWRPGYDPAKEAVEEGTKGRCPKCGFSHKWNGVHCGHCGYTTGATPTSFRDSSCRRSPN